MAAPELAQTDPEGMEGVRMTWLNWPRSKVEAAKCVIPIAASIQPIRPNVDLEILPYPPLRCKTCSAVLNPFCRVDFTALIWICPFCFQRNHFPQHYSSISQTNVPAELYPNFLSIEYSVPNYQNPQSHDPSVAPNPIYLFVLDTCMITEELNFAKSELKRAIGMVPDSAMVGFITFGTQVHVHELGFLEMSKVYVFNGSKELAKDQVMKQLGLAVSSSRRAGQKAGGGHSPMSRAGPNFGIKRFLMPASECEYTLNSLLDELEPDQWPVKPGNRVSRCTGVALSVAAGLVGASVDGTGARIITLLGGPSTEGPGVIVSKDLSDPVRSHKDLVKDAAPFFKKSVHFYDELGKQLVRQGHVLDVFASALDQVGIAEMKVAIERTGGLIVLAESFGHSVFKDSFKRIFEDGEQSLGLSFNGTLEINCSKDIKVQGIIGPCSSLEKRSHVVANAVIGQGNTKAWKLCGLDKNTCLTVFFDVSSTDKSEPDGTNPHLFIQFLTSYQSPDGQMRLRVTTVTRQWVENTTSYEELIQGFDQEVAAVVVARLCSYKMETEGDDQSASGDINKYSLVIENTGDWFYKEGFDATRWLDWNLIRLCSRFGDYRKDDPASFTLSSNFSLFPQFMFNLRRSQFVQVFNNSPDETAYFRILLNRETVSNATVMIQPSLICYAFNSLPAPALLDVQSVAADRILLLDAYFSVVIFHGMTIAQWRNMGYQHQPEHKGFALLLQAPHDDAQLIIRDRFPVPRLVVCDQHGSQARFLLAKLNPSATYNNAHEIMNTGSHVLFTDDVSLQIFVQHLQRLAVQDS